VKKVLIYADEGASARCIESLVFSLQQENIHHQHPIAFADRFLLSRRDWQPNTALLIFPGGRDLPYHAALKGEGNRQISKFVASGGNYLGICAGGYYGCRLIEFEKGLPLEVIGNRELAFFPGIASGPAYGSGRFSYECEKGAKIANLQMTLNGSIVKVSAYYNGGCTFIDAEAHDEVDVIARFSDLPDSPAAIIQCSYGKGSAILSGVHPEYSGYYLKTEDPHLKNLLPVLQSAEEERKKLFRYLLFCLDLVADT
jgi:glutamine amidotransferase-like uncharacterized protein